MCVVKFPSCASCIIETSAVPSFAVPTSPKLLNANAFPFGVPWSYMCMACKSMLSKLHPTALTYLGPVCCPAVDPSVFCANLIPLYNISNVQF